MFMIKLHDAIIELYARLMNLAIRKGGKWIDKRNDALDKMIEAETEMAIALEGVITRTEYRILEHREKCVELENLKN